jgi:Raf kinase inhibitor-like YbhB/YbcL family protein
MRNERSRWLRLALVLLAGTFGVGCKSAGPQPSAPPGTPMSSLAVTSKSFPSGGLIPVDYTCDGADKSPQLTWSAPPAGTKTLALVVDDPDAPGGDFTHWIVFDMRPDTLGLPEGADPAQVGGAVGLNGFNRAQYSGPCPPRMEGHRYYFRVFALDAPLDVKLEPMRDAVDAAMSGHVLAEGALMGTFAH